MKAGLVFYMSENILDMFGVKEENDQENPMEESPEEEAWEKNEDEMSGADVVNNLTGTDKDEQPVSIASFSLIGPEGDDY